MASYPTRSRRRANGEGSIYPYRGRWRGAVSWTNGEGIRQVRTVYGKAQAEVRLALAELRAQLDKGLEPPKVGTVSEFLAAWLAASRQRVRPASWQRTELAVRLHLTPTLGGLPLARMSPADVERMTAALIDRGLAPRTAHTARSVLHRALADAQRDGLVHRNVAALARPPHVPVRSLTARRDYFEPADLRRIVTAAKVHPLGPLVTLAASTGLRLGELLGLTWADVDTEAATLTVRRSLARSWDGWALAEPKTPRSRRTINLPAAAISALDSVSTTGQTANSLDSTRAWTTSRRLCTRTRKETSRVT